MRRIRSNGFNRRLLALRDALRRPAKFYHDDFADLLPRFSRETGWPLPLNRESKRAFKDWIDGHYGTRTITSVHDHLKFRRLCPSDTWLVHFTNHAYAVAREGFRYGVTELHRIAFTRGSQGNGQRPDAPGFNYAFEADGKPAASAAKWRGLGTEAVLFQAAGIVVRHSADKNEQVIFWGPDVTEFIPIELRYSYRSTVIPTDWCVRDQISGRVLFGGTYTKVVAWITKNVQQYRRQLVRVVQP